MIELASNQEILPSGMYKAMLVRKLLERYQFESPVLEVGCATGEFLDKLASLGKSGVGIDPCAESIEVAKARLEGKPFEVLQNGLFEYDGRGFRSLFIFEVLEHIEADIDAMRRPLDMLEPGGLIMLSVPAKQNLYTEEDAFQGHVRRYERDEMRSKLEAAGFEIKTFWCYNPLPYIRKYLMPKGGENSKDEKSMERRTEESAYDMHPFTNKWVRRLYPIYSRAKFLLRFQDLFLQTDFGAHYLVVAQKPMA